MKKKIFSWILFLGLLVLPTVPAIAESFDYVGGSFDWLYMSNEERTERVSHIFNIMFPKGYVANFPRGFLKDRLKNHLKDRAHEAHYEAVCAGYTHYKDVDLQPFFAGKSKFVYMYALQYQKAPQKTFYYDAMGKLKFIDFRYGDYPQCPYYTKKYAINGKLVRAMYLQNPDTMYIFSDKGSFIGVKYQNNVYGFNYQR
ncbi:MAG: hypothetical protein K6E29_05540 [Cyanobacteria bacterium RUI128]|nr:hypothetical protein [Cyanobacteria bacterium RUI128]